MRTTGWRCDRSRRGPASILFGGVYPVTGIRLSCCLVAVAILIAGCGSSEKAVEKKAPRHGVRIVLQSGSCAVRRTLA